MPKVQPPELKGFMDKKLSSERLCPPPPTVPRTTMTSTTMPRPARLCLGRAVLCPVAIA